MVRLSLTLLAAGLLQTATALPIVEERQFTPTSLPSDFPTGFANGTPYRTPHELPYRHPDFFTLGVPYWHPNFSANGFPYWYPDFCALRVPYELSYTHGIPRHEFGLSGADRLPAPPPTPPSTPSCSVGGGATCP
ncbi:hypothetical protein CIB48_g9423 [Xylaria polymorpha]|nr:hypothetical protein CIB48_g9423 [Xylaria polymorpha]